jgi:hypothetical protein
MPLQRALKAVETATDADDPGNSVTERHTAFGTWWRYAHSGDGPHPNLVGAIKIAAFGAEQEARKDGKTYLVATSSERWPDVYVFPHDHPDARRLDLTPMYTFTPPGNAYAAARPAISSVPRLSFAYRHGWLGPAHQLE